MTTTFTLPFDLARAYDGAMIQGKSERILSKPDVCGGKPCVAGTRIRVQDIYIWHDIQGQSADEIVSRFPQLTMADVYAAMAFYWEHRDEIQKHMHDDATFVDALRNKTPSLITPKVTKTNATDDSVSSG